MKNRKKHNYDEALEMLRERRGAGTSKPIKVHVEFEFSGLAGVQEATSIIATTKMFEILTISNLVYRSGVGSQKDAKNIKTNSYVQTELEDNPHYKG